MIGQTISHHRFPDKLGRAAWDHYRRDTATSYGVGKEAKTATCSATGC